MVDLEELNNLIATVIFSLSCVVGFFFWSVAMVIIGAAIKNWLFKKGEEK